MRARVTSSDAVGRGRRALQRGAWAEARDLFSRADSPEALEGLGWSLYWLDEMEESLDVRERAYRAFLERKDRVAAARVAMGLAAGSYDLRGGAVATGWLERAKSHLKGVAASPVHGWLALNEGHFARLVADDAAAAKKHAQSAARIARKFGDTELELLARSLEGLALVNLGDVVEGMRRVDEATAAAIAGEITDLDSIAQTCCMLLYACERVRDYKRAAEWQQRIDRFCREWKIEPLFAVCATQHAALLAGCGRWPEAEAKLEAAMERLEKTRPLVLPDAIVRLAELRRRQGRFEAALALVARVETRTEAMLTRAAIELDRGDPAAALDFADRLLALRMGEKWVERAATLELVVRAALMKRDLRRAHNAQTTLEQTAARIGTPMIRAIERSAAGRIGLAGGDLDDARAAFAESFGLFVAAQAPFEGACARVALAETLSRLGQTSTARDELEKAIATLQKLGAQHDLARARELLQSIKSGAAAVPKGRLTSREREVLHLIADGMGDKQLAVRLSVSEHTVHRHVANILRKLSVTSRTAAVAQAVRSGWL